MVKYVTFPEEYQDLYAILHKNIRYININYCLDHQEIQLIFATVEEIFF